MSENQNYLVISFDEKHIKDMTKEVNDFISQGYKPIGGISARVGNGGGAYLMQAMIKEGEL